MGKHEFVTGKFGPGDKLYKYFSNVDYAIAAIRSGCIHLDDTATYNDPFEPLFLKAKISEEKKEAESKYKMSCFCETWSSILMWSYYANCHKGVCLEFDMNRLRKYEGHSDYGHLSSLYQYINPVHYSTIRPEVSDATEEKKARCLLTKADVWGHEHEWRLISETDDDKLPFDCVSGIYFGVKNDKNQGNVKTLIGLGRRKGFEMYQCELDAEEYRIRRKLI